MEEKEIVTVSDEELKEIFRKHKMKITPQRMIIYKELKKSREHPSASVIYERIRKSFPNISFDTVNRTLLTFLQFGIIKSVEGSGDPKRFDPNVHDHHHFICVKCGRIVDFDNEEFDNLQIPEEIKKKFKVLRHRVVIEGICDRCLNETKEGA